MRDSEKNKTKIYYALRNVSVEKDEWGNTHDVATYSVPIETKISVSPNKGEVAFQAFGADLRYDREMVTHDMSCPIDEYSRLWIDDGDSPIRSSVTSIAKGVGDAIVIDPLRAYAVPVDDGIGLVFDFPLDRPHNYEVAAVSRSLNCIRYAIRKVNVSL